MNKIDEKTLIPVGVLLFIAAGIFWLTTLYSTVAATQEEVKDHSEQLKNMSDRLPRIEEKVNFIYDWVKKEQGE